MATLTATLKRILRRPLRRRRSRSAEGHISLARSEHELSRSAVVLARNGRYPAARGVELLSELWQLDTTALFIQLDRVESACELVLTRYVGRSVVASGQQFRVEVATNETAPDGAYLDEREYRRLGFYEVPPPERVLVMVRIAAGSGRTCLVDVPPYVSHVTVLTNGRVITAARTLPARGAVRYRFTDDGALAD